MSNAVTSDVMSYVQCGSAEVEASYHLQTRNWIIRLHSFHPKSQKGKYNTSCTFSNVLLVHKDLLECFGFKGTVFTFCLKSSAG